MDILANLLISGTISVNNWNTNSSLGTFPTCNISVPLNSNILITDLTIYRENNSNELIWENEEQSDVVLYNGFWNAVYGSSIQQKITKTGNGASTTMWWDIINPLYWYQLLVLFVST